MRQKLLVIILIISLFGLGCLTKPVEDHSSDTKKIMFLGVDALDWERVDKLTKEGKLPHISSLMHAGTSAKLNSNDKGGSAVFWTTIATGQQRNKHGITSFYQTDKKTKELTPLTSNMRKTKSFWNIYSENNNSVGIVGWFVTWPAEPVNGFMISSYFVAKDTTQYNLFNHNLYAMGTIYEDAPDIVYPPELKSEVNQYIQKARVNYDNNLDNLIAPNSLKLLINESNKFKVQWSFLADEIYAEIAYNLYKIKKPDVFAVYFSGIDVAGHRFTRSNKKQENDLIKKFGPIVENYYQQIDNQVGRFIDLADDNTIIILSADHGLMRGHHTNNGVFIINGPGVNKNIRSTNPINLTDITPTMLYLTGMPVANDMDGNIYTDAINQTYLTENLPQYIPTYGLRNASENPIESPFDDEIIERLKSLGYIKQ